MLFVTEKFSGSNALLQSNSTTNSFMSLLDKGVLCTAYK